MQIKNNTILITGGSSGIGLELAKQFLKLDNVVIVTGRNQKKLEAVKKEYPKIHVLQSDLSKLTDIKNLCEHLPKQFPDLNILINNAGVGRKLNLLNIHDVLILNEEIITNLQAPILMTNFLLPFLLRQPSSAIVNVTSALAFSPLPIAPIYSASKAGLHSFTIALRQQLEGTSIKVFEIAPPTTQTDMINAFSVKDLKGVSVLSTEELVEKCLNGLMLDNYEICPGQARWLQILSRIAPRFLVKHLSKSLKNE